VETGALGGERGAHRPTRPIQAIEVPATVQVILAARIDRLPAADKQLLQTASIIGKDVPSVLLNAVADATEEAVLNALWAAPEVVGRDGHVGPALPHDDVLELLDRHRRLGR